MFFEKLCSISSNSRDHAHFCYMVSYLDNINSFIESSLTLSGHLFVGASPLFLRGGIQTLNYVNNSDSICSYYSGPLMGYGMGNSKFCINYRINSTVTSGVEFRKEEYNYSFSKIINSTSKFYTIAVSFEYSVLRVRNVIICDANCIFWILSKWYRLCFI